MTIMEVGIVFPNFIVNNHLFQGPSLINSICKRENENGETNYVEVECDLTAAGSLQIDSRSFV